MRSILYIACAAAMPASADILTYNSADGTPDPAQWTLILDDAAPAPTVSGGSLLIDTTPFSRFARQDYRANITEGSLNDDQWVFEVEAQVLSSPQGNGFGFWRAGFSMGITDENGDFVSLEIGETSMSLRNDNNAGQQVTGLDLTSGFNTFRIEAENGLARALLNGSEVASIAVGAGTGASTITVGWGDRTNIFNGSVRVRSAFLSVPTPASAAVLGALGLATRRRRGS